MIKAVICDDELATRNIICHFLEEEQLPIEIVGNAEDGEEAIQLIKETSPRLIFLDIHMPQKNGFQVIEEVSREVGAQIIVLTAFASFENAQQALRLGVSDILSKPVDFEQLKAAIFRAIGWKFTSNETVNVMLEYIHNHYNENMELEDLQSDIQHREPSGPAVQEAYGYYDSLLYSSASDRGGLSPALRS